MTTDLATQTDQRLRAAGYTEKDPVLAWLRAWNAAAFERAARKRGEHLA